MNCNDATGHLDRMIFEKAPADPGLLQHIDTCSSCSQLYRDALKARKVMDLVRCLEPVLNDPDEFTENIMSAIGQEPQKTFFVPLFLQRTLAAASIAMFLLFGYEQYGVVKKVSAMEIQFSQINAGISISDIERLLSTVNGKTALSYSYIRNQLNQRTIK
jgi:hypothetical protein